MALQQGKRTSTRSRWGFCRDRRGTAYTCPRTTRNIQRTGRSGTYSQKK